MGQKVVQSAGKETVRNVQPQQTTVTEGQKPKLQGREAALLNLQRMHGNRYVNQMLKGGILQQKLRIGAINDPLEWEADRVAKQVMSIPDSATHPPIQREMALEEEEIQAKPLAAIITPLVQRDMALEEEEKVVQAKRSSDVAFSAESNLESRLISTQGRGRPLPEDVRSFMEPRFGADFSQVRVHTGSESVQMNQELGAQAFTHGSHIYYSVGKSPAKDQLTGHELSHVVQQTPTTAQPSQALQRKPQFSVLSTNAISSYPEAVTKISGLIQRAPEPQPYQFKSPDILEYPRLVAAGIGLSSPLKKGDSDPPKAIGKNNAILGFKTLLMANLGVNYDQAPDITKDGDVSGYYGPQTVVAVKQLQQLMDVPNPDGLSAGKQTIRALDELDAGGGKRALASIDSTTGKLPSSGAAPLAMADLVHRQMVVQGAAATANLVVASWREEPADWLYFVFNALLQNHRLDHTMLFGQPALRGGERLAFINQIVVLPNLLTADPTQAPHWFPGFLNHEDLLKLYGVALSGLIVQGNRAFWDDPEFGIPKKGQIPFPPRPQVPGMIESIKQVRYQTRINRGMDQRGIGWVYSAASNAGRLPAEVSASPLDSIERAIWDELGSEGSAASINTYDGGMVTWGTGFAATGELSNLMKRMDPKIMTELYRAGVAVAATEKGKSAESSFRYVDTSAEVVLTGRDATNALRNDPKTLSIMISSGEGHLQEMLDATWAQIKAVKLTSLDKKPKLKAAVKMWPKQLIKFCTHAMHFSGALDWDSFVSLGGSDGSNVKAIIAAVLRRANYRMANNGAHIAIADSVRTAAVPYDFGKEEGEKEKGQTKKRTLLQDYVSTVEPLPADAEINPDYNGIWFLPIGYGADIPDKPGKNCRRFVDH